MREKKKGVPPVISEYFAKLGKHKSGAGGRALAAKMTPEQRSAAARKAVQARWVKVRVRQQLNVSKATQTADETVPPDTSTTE